MADADVVGPETIRELRARLAWAHAQPMNAAASMIPVAPAVLAALLDAYACPHGKPYQHDAPLYGAPGCAECNAPPIARLPRGLREAVEQPAPPLAPPPRPAVWLDRFIEAARAAEATQSPRRRCGWCLDPECPGNGLGHPTP